MRSTDIIINNRVWKFPNTFNITNTQTDRIRTYRTDMDAFTVTYSNRRGRRQTCIWWTRCCTNKRFLWQNRRPSIKLENKTWLKRKCMFWKYTQTWFFVSYSSGLTVLEKGITFLFCSRGFTGMQTDVNWREDSFGGSGGNSSVL